MQLILFDMDGTLIDSQAEIVASMNMAFEAMDLTPPARENTLSIVGLSLPQALFRLAPDQNVDMRDALVEGYKSSFMKLRQAGHKAPLYPGALDCLDALTARDDVVLGIATGKSRRGLDAVFEQAGLAKYFETIQVSDDHPSKPHPSMALTAMDETGADCGVMIGDTTFDMEMGRAAGLQTVGVTWGYHSPDILRPFADAICDRYSDMTNTLAELDKK